MLHIEQLHILDVKTACIGLLNTDHKDQRIRTVSTVNNNTGQVTYALEKKYLALIFCKNVFKNCYGHAVKN